MLEEYLKYWRGEVVCCLERHQLGRCGWTSSAQPPRSASAPAQRFYLYRNIYGTSQRQPGKGTLGSCLRQGGMQSHAKIKRTGWAFCFFLKKRGRGGREKMGIRPKLKNKRREITPLKSIKHHQMSLRFPGSVFPYNTPFSVFFFLPSNVFILQWKKPILIFFSPLPCVPVQKLFSVWPGEDDGWEGRRAL